MASQCLQWFPRWARHALAAALAADLVVSTTVGLTDASVRRPRHRQHPTHHRRSAHLQCEAAWGRFADGSPLDTTQVVAEPQQSSDFTNFTRHSGEQGLFVFPKARFAFCLIEKNGCTAWNTLFNKLVNDDPLLEGPDFFMSERYSSADDMAAVFSDPSAFRAVVVREPLARFASAFLDKCYAKGCNSPYCFARSEGRRGYAISFADAVDWMLRTDPTNVDGHWGLQSEHCELHKRVREYNVIGLMKHGTLDRDAECITRRAGLDRFDTQGEGSPNLFWANATGREQADGEAAEEAILKKMFTKKAARALIQHFAQDYETFHFPAEPAWVEHATGEWYLRALQNKCVRAVSFLETGGGSGVAVSRAADEDDLAKLATRSGYTP